MASVAELRKRNDKLRANLESLKSQLQHLEQVEPGTDLAVEVQRQAAIATARDLIIEREAELQAAEAEAEAAALDEAREKAIASLLKRADKAAERYSDGVMSLAAAAAELQSVNAESISVGNGAIFLGVGAIKVPPRLVQCENGKNYRTGTI